MTRKILFVIAAAMAMAGCTTLDQLTGRGVVTQHTSDFDNATVIEASPNNIADTDGMWTDSTALGASWSSAAPDSVTLTMALTGSSGNVPFTGIRAFFVNIDGVVSQYSAGQPVNTAPDATGPHRLYGSNEIVIPYSVLQQMVAAKDCRLRIQTSTGYRSFDFTRDHMAGGKPAAICSIMDMMAKVATVRSNG
ncbi:MAG: hypothetical protein ACREPQ_12490 [Rhodanobacter sp.]